MYPPCRSTPAKAFDARRAVRFILTALVFARVPADLPATGELTAAPCPAASLRVVRLIVVNEAGIAPAALDAAAAEAGAIWNEAGIRLEWTFAPTSFEQRDEDTVIVVIRRALRTRAASDTGEPSPSRALGRISFSPEDRPANLIEVSLDALTQLVMAGVQFDRPIPKLPLANQRALVGRGLGRVVAHELGHWLGGRGHLPGGVMKAAFDTRDLVASLMPLLPPAWRPLLGAGVPARSSRCEPAPVAHVKGGGKDPMPPHTGGTGR